MTRIVDDVKLDFKDVLLMPKRSELDSRSKVDLVRSYKFKHAITEYTGVPIIAANMDHTGTMKMADAFIAPKMAVALHKFYTVKSLTEYFKRTHNPHTFYSMGITDADYEKFKAVMDNGIWPIGEPYRPTYVCIDVANGYSRKFVSYVERIRQEFPDIVIMAGNVVTPDMTYDLLERGADIVKIGIGPGSVCTTRKITGVGYPQLSAIMECADAAHGANGLICADGGVAEAGDVAKAFAGGADFVMCGGLFAGHDECEGELLYSDGKTNSKTKSSMGSIELIPTKMRFYGMSSQEAMDKHYGGKAAYRASEGKAVEVPYKGSIILTLDEVLGGLRSACTYVGARSLKQLPKCATFVKVNRILNDKFE